tara:strand:- start:2878 stop:4008 length:1131 start_codon:yes stop_codon:yes gene_type:complete
MGLSLSDLNPVRIAEKTFDGVKKIVNKTAKTVKKTVKKVGELAEKAVKGVVDVQKKVFKGVKKLTRNKYVRLGLMITAAVMLPGAIAALPAITGLGVTSAAIATNAIVGGVLGAGGVLLSGGKFKDALKAGALGSATAAAFTKIGQTIKGAQTTKSVQQTFADTLETTKIDVSSLPKDATGAVDLDALKTSITDSSFNVDTQKSLLDVTSPIDISRDISMGDQIQQSLAEYNIDVNQLTESQRQAVGLGTEIETTKSRFGDKIKGRFESEIDELKSKYSPTGLAAQAEDKLEEAIFGSDDEGQQPSTTSYAAATSGATYLPDEEGRSYLESIASVYRQAEINPADAFRTLYYGPASTIDTSYLNNPLSVQNIIRIT